MIESVKVKLIDGRVYSGRKEVIIPNSVYNYLRGLGDKSSTYVLSAKVKDAKLH